MGQPDADHPQIVLALSAPRGRADGERPRCMQRRSGRPAPAAGHACAGGHRHASRSSPADPDGHRIPHCLTGADSRSGAHCRAHAPPHRRPPPRPRQRRRPPDAHRLAHARADSHPEAHRLAHARADRHSEAHGHGHARADRDSDAVPTSRFPRASHIHPRRGGNGDRVGQPRRPRNSRGRYRRGARGCRASVRAVRGGGDRPSGRSGSTCWTWRRARSRGGYSPRSKHPQRMTRRVGSYRCRCESLAGEPLPLLRSIPARPRDRADVRVGRASAATLGIAGRPAAALPAGGRRRRPLRHHGRHAATGRAVRDSRRAGGPAPVAQLRIPLPRGARPGA